MIRHRYIVTLTCALALVPVSASAYREAFTAEQRTQMEKIQTVLADVVALTDKGAVDPAPQREVVVRRMDELGYTTVTDPAKPNDVVIKVKCEQRKTWEGTTTRGGDADLPDAPSRVWKGPACQFYYLLGGTRIPWQKEVRTDFEDAVAAAQSAKAADPGAYALAKLKDELERFEFPMLFAAEWGQGNRLLKVLDDPRASQARKLKAIALLGDLMNDDALPQLKEALKDKNLSQEALVAMGSLGRDGIPVLTDIMLTSKNPDLQAAAAKGLGRVGGLSGDPRVIPPLLQMLERRDVERKVQIEVVWALGKIPDKHSIEPLRTLFAEVLKIRDPEDRELQQLKEALNWSIKQCDVDGHIS